MMAEPVPGRCCGRGIKSLVGAGHFREESVKFDGIFFAGGGLDAAGYVHGVGADGQYSFGNVFWSEASGEEDGIFCRGAFCDLPIGQTA
jgi:hypothetical protein